MFLTIIEGYENDRIFRDARYFLYIFEILVIGLFIWQGLQSGRLFSERVVIGSLLVVFFAPFGWYCITLFCHGSITLDGKREILEFSESWNLDIPSLTVPRENIDQVKVSHHWITAWQTYLIILRIQDGDQYKEKALMLGFGSYDDCCQSAQLIGKFANKPAFDVEGKMLLPR